MCKYDTHKPKQTRTLVSVKVLGHTSNTKYFDDSRFVRVWQCVCKVYFFSFISIFIFHQARRLKSDGNSFIQISLDFSYYYSFLDKTIRNNINEGHSLQEFPSLLWTQNQRVDFHSYNTTDILKEYGILSHWSHMGTPINLRWKSFST